MGTPGPALAAIAVCLSALAIRAWGAEFHISPRGADRNPGTRARPFATLERARDAVRESKTRAPLPAGGITVWLHAGAYRLERSFQLTDEDSGSAEAPIAYRAAEGETVRIVGGPVVPPGAFAPVTDVGVLARLDPGARPQVLQADLKALGLTDFGAEWPAKFRGYAGWPELFVDSRPMTLARWPNEGYARVAKVVDPGSKPRWGEAPDRGGTFQYDGDRPARWAQADNGYLNGHWAFQWFDECLKVAKIDPEAKTIAFTAPHVYGLGTGFVGEFFALNLLEELDSPGEYFLDRTTGALYLWPPEPLEGREIGLSLLADPLLALNGTEWVTLQGLTLEFARGHAVTVTGGHDNRLVGCTIRNIATDAIRIDGGTNNGVRACDLYNMGGGGISLSGGDRATLTPCGNYAENNHLHHFGRLFRAHRDAINLNGVGCRASHNLIHDAPHHAMDFGGNEHLIEYNEIHHVCLESDDAGAIYTGRNWTVRGTVIRHNYFHAVGGGSGVGNQAVYLDDTACGTVCVGNVVRDVYRAFLIGGGRDNILRDNVMVNCPIPLHIDNRGMGGEWLEGQEVYHKLRNDLKEVPYQGELWRARYPDLADILEVENGLPAGNVIERNLMFRCGQMNVAQEAREHSMFEANWETNDDPGFVDAAHEDFALRPDAEAFGRIPGLEAIPFGRIGLVVDEYRRALPAATPWIEPQSGGFVGEVEVTLGCRTPGAIIRYTLDGTGPAQAAARYTGPIRLADTTTVRAVAFGPGDHPESRSGTASAVYRVLKLGPGEGVYLSDLAPADAFVHGGLKKDGNYTGEPIRIAGRQFAKGLSTHPETTDRGGRATVEYALERGLAAARRFQAWVGIDDSAQNAGSCTFLVEVERNGQWEKVFESDILRGGQPAAEIDVDITGALRLRLTTTDAGDNIYSDHAEWADARLE
ncbi:MAG: hypothetical protein FJX74_18420 [Armatimonadetes bacterium]|nr:hypothetical protein [Armatimonadota bacterium]